MLDIRSAPAAPGAEALDLGEGTASARAAAGAFARDLDDDAELDAATLSAPLLTAVVEGLVLGAHRRKEAPEHSVRLCGATDEQALRRGLQRAQATLWARDLTNTPARVKTPAWLGDQAAGRLAPLGVEVTVRDEAWLAEQGCGGLLGVGGGSSAPPRLIEARWRPRGARAGLHPVLVGKGITFDTGGYNRKVAAGMRMMHTDMAGGAAALAALELVARWRLPLRVTVLVPAAENSISGSAYRPSDVLRHYGGRTTEIVNTDAEGRLVLADALAYALARLKPSTLVDVATLTGAMAVTFGRRTAGLFATSDGLAAALLAAGAASGEVLWRLPLVADYEAMLQSQVADAVNAPPDVKGIVAALFLRHFVGAVPWAHLDIAGTARATQDDGYLTAGATGFGARLLATWLESLV